MSNGGLKHPRRAVVTGGGTAGHVVPSLPVVEALLAMGAEVHFVGSNSGLEERLVAPLGIAYHGISTGKLRRYCSVENLLDALRIPLGVWQAWRLMRRLKPDVVFSKGGFVSFPAVVGAWLSRAPVVAHESDLTPGLANRLAQPFVKCLCVNFEATTAGVRRVVTTGTPLRRSLVEGDAQRGRSLLGVAPDRQMLLVVGGSLGAVRLNEVVRAALGALLEDYDVVHICGPGKLDETLSDERGYVQREFVSDDWGDIIAAADLVVSRAGANALYEWLALGKPHLLVPLPRSVSRGDQIENAAHAEAKGWSLVLPEHKLDPASLITGVAELASRSGEIRQRLQAVDARDSVALIVDELVRAARRGR